MTTDNIDKFDRIALQVLKYLYQQFPAAARPDPNCIGLTRENPGQTDEGMGRSENWDHLSDDLSRVVSWLIDEGMIHDHDYKIGPSYVLSIAGFKALSKIAPECRPPKIISESS